MATHESTIAATFMKEMLGAGFADITPMPEAFGLVEAYLTSKISALTDAAIDAKENSAKVRRKLGERSQFCALMRGVQELRILCDPKNREERVC